MDYTIGQLARLSGVTVRTLHHYEKQGLLVPAARSASGYRRYSKSDVLVLHRILACRQMGVSLKDIAVYLEPTGPSLGELLAKQAARTRADIVQLQSLLSKIERLLSISSTNDESSLPSELLDLMTVMQSLQQHYTSDELKELVAIRDSLTPEDQQEMRRTVRSLLEGFGAAQAKKADPQDAQVRALARQWLALGALAPASREVTQKTRALLDTSDQVQRATGISPGLKGYIDQALAAARAAR
ncbi:MerR family transcriptional regulator [Roseateles sp.]|uniref:MerR family transcriptional regulator n=1 Tax=Roseateles sp. TaxID=1971397 RepID=UPI0039E9AAE1